MHPEVKTAGTSQYESSDDFARIPYLKEWKVARSASEQVPPEANAGGASKIQLLHRLSPDKRNTATSTCPR